MPVMHAGLLELPSFFERDTEVVMCHVEVGEDPERCQVLLDCGLFLTRASVTLLQAHAISRTQNQRGVGGYMYAVGGSGGYLRRHP